PGRVPARPPPGAAMAVGSSGGGHELRADPGGDRWLPGAGYRRGGHSRPAAPLRLRVPRLEREAAPSRGGARSGAAGSRPEETMGPPRSGQPRPQPDRMGTTRDAGSIRAIGSGVEPLRRGFLKEP